MGRKNERSAANKIINKILLSDFIIWVDHCFLSNANYTKNLLDFKTIAQEILIVNKNPD